MTFKIWIVTLFPEYFKPLLECGVAGSALRGERGIAFELHTLQLRDFSPKDYKGVDDAPYGGGAGMVMRADILYKALEEIAVRGHYGTNFREHLHVVYTSPRGEIWNQKKCETFAKIHFASDAQVKDLVFICGRYEGIDERFIEQFVDEQISIGDYVLTGGEVAVLTILDSALRFVPGVLGNAESAVGESFGMDGLLEHPQYTRPAEFLGLKIPEVLLSGHHANILKWQKEQREMITQKYRPDLYQDYIKQLKPFKKNRSPKGE